MKKRKREELRKSVTEEQFAILEHVFGLEEIFAIEQIKYSTALPV